MFSVFLEATGYSSIPESIYISRAGDSKVRRCASCEQGQLQNSDLFYASWLNDYKMHKNAARTKLYNTSAAESIMVEQFLQCFDLEVLW